VKRPQAHAWLSAGFLVDMVNQEGGNASIRFRRVLEHAPSGASQQLASSTSSPPLATITATHTAFSEFPFDMHGLMSNVANSRPLFHSEADFQHAFAWEVHRQFPDASFRLEKPISTKGGVVHLDVLVERGEAIVAIELKYKTRKLSVETPTETFNLRNHSAQDLGRYDFIKDVSRLEDISLSYPRSNSVYPPPSQTQIRRGRPGGG
jgi:hypothetical protein